MRNYTANAKDEKGIPANVPPRHYDPEDRIELAGPVRRTKGVRRAAIEGVNVPAPGEDYQALNSWRARYNLSPITGE